MDLVDLIEEKKFLGQEFLTWLWWKSDTDGSISTESGPVAVLVGEKMTVDGGENGRVVCSKARKLVEAMSAMAQGKIVEQAQFKVWQEDREYLLTIGASMFDFKSVKMPRTGSEEDGYDGLILERVYLIQSLRNCVYSLFREFIKARLGDGWSDDVDEIREWILTGELDAA